MKQKKWISPKIKFSDHFKVKNSEIVKTKEVFPQKQLNLQITL